MNHFLSGKWDKGKEVYVEGKVEGHLLHFISLIIMKWMLFKVNGYYHVDVFDFIVYFGLLSSRISSSSSFLLLNLLFILAR